MAVVAYCYIVAEKKKLHPTDDQDRLQKSDVEKASISGKRNEALGMTTPKQSLKETDNELNSTPKGETNANENTSAKQKDASRESNAGKEATFKPKEVSLKQDKPRESNAGKEITTKQKETVKTGIAKNAKVWKVAPKGNQKNIPEQKRKII